MHRQTAEAPRSERTTPPPLPPDALRPRLTLVQQADLKVPYFSDEEIERMLDIEDSRSNTTEAIPTLETLAAQTDNELKQKMAATVADARKLAGPDVAPLINAVQIETAIAPLQKKEAVLWGGLKKILKKAADLLGLGGETKALPAEAVEANAETETWPGAAVSVMSGDPHHDTEGKDVNEDSVICNDELGLYAVADGLGGQGGGYIASRLGVEIISTGVLELKKQKPRPSIEAQADALELIFNDASEAILEQTKKDGVKQNRASTASAFLVEGRDVAMVHVGDSRVYVYHPDSDSLEQLSQDHGTPDLAYMMAHGGVADKRFDPPKIISIEASSVNKLLARMNTYKQAADVDDLSDTEKEAFNFLWDKRNAMYMALGMLDLRAQKKVIKNLPEGAIVFAVTDGISDVVDQETILDKARLAHKNNLSMEEFGQSLVAVATAVNTTDSLRAKADDKSCSAKRI